MFSVNCLVLHLTSRKSDWKSHILLSSGYFIFRTKYFAAACLACFMVVPTPRTKVAQEGTFKYTTWNRGECVDFLLFGLALLLSLSAEEGFTNFTFPGNCSYSSRNGDFGMCLENSSAKWNLLETIDIIQKK